MADHPPQLDTLSPIYRVAFQNMNQGFCLLEKVDTPAGTPPDFRYLLTNQAFTQQSGLDQVVGKTLQQVVPRVEDHILAHYNEVALGGAPVHFETYVSTLDRWIDTYAFRIEAQSPHQIAVLFTDITARKQAEEALLANEKRFRTLVQNLPDYAIFQIDPHGLITEWTDGAQRVKGYTAQEVIGQSIALFYTPEGLAAGELTTEMEQATRAGRAERESVRIRKCGERFWVDEIMTAIRNEQGQLVGFTKISRDITERQQMEQALREADRRKDEFLAMLAHELRNPLAPLRNGLQILSLTEWTNPELAPLVDLMSRQLTHLVRLVDDLLDVSRISQGKIELKRERLELGALVGGAVDAARPLYQTRRKTLELALPTMPLLVDGDATRLTQVVTNLLTNGSRYTGEEGRVRVSLEWVQGEARLRVADNGIGLEAGQFDAIFELFVQVDNSVARSQGGLGLGLTLVKRLVEWHGGRVEVRSGGLGQGSEFSVYLPLLKEAKSQPMMSESPPPPTGQPSLLVIDDNADAALTLAMLLKLKGYQVHTRSSGRAGLAAAEHLRPAAILLDIGMPDLDGYETCHLLRQQPWGQAVPVVALTGYGQVEDQKRTYEAGFNAHLVKPVDLVTLTQLLTQLLAG